MPTSTWLTTCLTMPTRICLLEGLNAIHSAENVYSHEGEYASTEYQNKHAGTPIRADSSANIRVIPPIVRTHLETGRKALYVNEPFTVGIEGMSEEESRVRTNSSLSGQACSTAGYML